MRAPSLFDAAASPSVALLSNNHYNVLITAAGAGYSTWRGLDVTRWREDATRDCWGQFCYIRDLTDDRIWSVGHQPLCRSADEYEVEFHPDRAEFRRRDGDIETRWAVCVAAEADCELRAVTVVNRSRRSREVELTSFAEVCLSHRRADHAHPAFAELFLETEFDPTSGALLVRRRPRGVDEKPVWAIHFTLRIEPCIPPSWPGFEMVYRHHSATYRIRIDNSAGTGRGVRWIELDGQRAPNGSVPLLDDEKTHEVAVHLG